MLWVLLLLRWKGTHHAKCFVVEVEYTLLQLRPVYVLALKGVWTHLVLNLFLQGLSVQKDVAELLKSFLIFVTVFKQLFLVDESYFQLINFLLDRSVPILMGWQFIQPNITFSGRFTGGLAIPILTLRSRLGFRFNFWSLPRLRLLHLHFLPGYSLHLLLDVFA